MGSETATVRLLSQAPGFCQRVSAAVQIALGIATLSQGTLDRPLTRTVLKVTNHSDRCCREETVALCPSLLLQDAQRQLALLHGPPEASLQLPPLGHLFVFFQRWQIDVIVTDLRYTQLCRRKPTLVFR